MIDLSVIIVFLTMATVFFWLCIKTGQAISKENAIVGLFAVIFVAYCFMWSHTGFISSISEAFNQFPYYFLTMAGTETTFRVIKGKINEWKKQNNQTELKKKRINVKLLQNIYVLVTGITMLITFFIILIGENNKNTTLIMLPNLITPIYLGIMVCINVYILHSYKSIYIKEMITSYYLVTFTISLYEIIDWYVFIQGNYTEFAYYPDKTHLFDVYYLLANISLLIFIPRFIYAIQDSEYQNNQTKR